MLAVLGYVGYGVDHRVCGARQPEYSQLRLGIKEIDVRALDSVPFGKTILPTVSFKTSFEHSARFLNILKTYQIEFSSAILIRDYEKL